MAKRIKFLSFFILAFLVGFFAMKSYAYWASAAAPASVEDEITVPIGRWFRGYAQPYDSNTTYHEGDLIIYDGKIYFVNVPVLTPGSPDHNPGDPNTSWLRPMTYREDTLEYRWFHRYQSGDIVLYENKLYYWGDIIPHLPNVNNELPTEPGSNWVEFSSDPALFDNFWGRYKIYFKGDVVTFNSRQYRSEKDTNREKEPSENDSWWTLIP